jgi:hypothetical protein
MPKLDLTHILSRLNERLEQLVKGEEVARRELESLLTPQQIAAWDAEWEQQRELRKRRRARTKEEEAALGWKSKREVTIAAVEAAIREAEQSQVEDWQQLQRRAEIRQGRVFFDELNKQLDAGVDMPTAKTRANNALTRAGLGRLDERVAAMQGLSKRDREVREMEDAIRHKAESELSDEEREQLELLREHERAVAANSRKRGRSA